MPRVCVQDVDDEMTEMAELTEEIEVEMDNLRMEADSYEQACIAQEQYYKDNPEAGVVIHLSPLCHLLLFN